MLPKNRRKQRVGQMCRAAERHRVKVLSAELKKHLEHLQLTPYPHNKKSENGHMPWYKEIKKAYW